MGDASQKPVRIAIVDDSEEVREGLRFLLGMDPMLDVVTALRSAEELMRVLQHDRLAADLILMDIGLPGLDGIEATTQVKALSPPPRVLILTVFEDEDRLIRAIRAGADGYLLKNTPPAVLIAQIHETHNGGSPVSPSIAGRLLREVRNQARTTRTNDYGLTMREREILHDVANGLTYREIAESRGIAASTAKKHILHLYQKLEVTSKAQFVRKVMDEDLL